MSDFTLTPVELRSKEDVARLACALEKIPKPVLALRNDGGYMVGPIGEELQDGSALFFYHEESTVGDYLCYRTDEGREIAYYSQDASPLPTICAPVIKFRSFPVKPPSKRGDGRGNRSCCRWRRRTCRASPRWDFTVLRWTSHLASFTTFRVVQESSGVSLGPRRTTVQCSSCTVCIPSPRPGSSS
ncbi:MAG: hypothetical protein C0167_00330 [Nitrososphaera sp.]|nr:MAG: hypothetical protein C0167_00330 [Nitrososphaera sp.]